MTDKFKFLFENTGCMIDGVVYTAKTTPLYLEPVMLKDILERNVNQKYYLNKEQNSKFAYLKGSKKIERIGPNDIKYLYSEGACAYPDLLDCPGRTMLTSEGTINRSSHVVSDLDTGKNRFITPIEAERLQHFPDNWTNTGMPERRRYFMMGNALVTKIVNVLGVNLSTIINAE